MTVTEPQAKQGNGSGCKAEGVRVAREQDLEAGGGGVGAEGRGSAGGGGDEGGGGMSRWGCCDFSFSLFASCSIFSLISFLGRGLHCGNT